MSNVPSFPYSDLFTPTASGVGSGNPLTPTAGTWMATMLTVAAAVGLPTTSWQSGGPELSILQGMAVTFAEVDANISIMNQGGFLDFAASGSVTYVNTNGLTVVQPVTPDPSIPAQNPTGAPGWLDVLGQGFYGITRLQATFATNILAFVNVSASSTATYAPGSYHVANPSTGATYSNVNSLTIPPSTIAGTSVSSITGTSVVTVTTSSNHGLSTGATVYIPGVIGLALSQLFATIVVTSTNTFQLVGVTATGGYSSGGTVYVCTTSQFKADVIGPTSTSAPYMITSTVTSNAGVSCNNTLSFVGNNFESNTAYAARIRLSLAAISPNGAANAYSYIALTAQALLAAQTPSVTLDGGAITKVLAQGDPQSGVVKVTLANANPASNVNGANVVEGATNLAVTGAANNGIGAIRLAVSSTTGLNNNDWATVSMVLGTIEANGTWQITVIDMTHVDLQGSTFTNTYVSGGSVEAGDLGQVANLLQNTCTPDDSILIVQSATVFQVTINATVVVPASQAANYAVAANAAVSAYIASLPIGGTFDPVSMLNVIEYAIVSGTLVTAGVVGSNPSFVQAISVLTINGSTSNVVFPSATADAVLVAFNLTLVKV